jgi:hypothetical protein
MERYPDFGVAMPSEHGSRVPIHLALCFGIAATVLAVMLRPNRDAGEPSVQPLEAALPPAASGVLLDVLAEGPLVSNPVTFHRSLDVLAEGPLVTAATP